MSPKISVIIPTYNKVEHLELTLFCLGKQDLSVDLFEVIVIDDGSTDDTKAFLEKLRSRYNLRFFHQSNSGQAIARNFGLQQARGGLIVFIDDDLLTPAHFLRTHLEAHQHGAEKIVLGRIHRINAAEFAAIRSLILGNDESIFDELSGFVKQDLYLDMVERIFKQNFLALAWICFTGGNSSLKRELLLKVGGFDRNFYRWGPEDIELGFRLYSNGIPFEYAPHAYNFHLDVVKDRNQMLKETARNLRHLRNKYPDDQGIKAYIDFTSGGFSLEEFYCRQMGIAFDPDDYNSLFCFRPFDYINLKSEVK